MSTHRLGVLTAGIFLVLNAFSFAVLADNGPPLFSKSFIPDIIGPGSSTTLTFTIENTDTDTVDDMAFTDVLPTELVIATPASASNACDGILSAPDGGGTISLTGGRLGAFETCTISVNITSTITGEGPFTNTSGDLTSTSGNSGIASADLMVNNARPGFSKAFAPNSISLGAESTLTFTIDNSAGTSALSSLDFVDDLPAGMVVASPTNVTTDCGLGATVTAVPGGTTVVFFLATLSVGATCTVSADVTTTTNGTFDNISGDLFYSVDNIDISVGFATATLEVPLEDLNKVFLDDPVPPGATTTLRFTVVNPSRTDTATGLTFTDPLPAGFSLSSGPDPDPPCGTGSALTGSTTLTFAGGTLPPEGSCTFEVVLDVPAGAAPGTYTNTTAVITGDIGGSPFLGNAATDDVTIEIFPLFTKTFTDDPVGAGGTVTLEFTLTNTGPSALMGLEFEDLLAETLVGLAANSLVDGRVEDPVFDICGDGSELTVFDPPDIVIGSTTIVTPADPTILLLTGGSLAAAGSPGDTCTFSVVLDVPAGAGGGVYPNTTSTLTGATSGETPIIGLPATDDLIVVGAVALSKEFTDDPVNPPGSATLEFTLTNLNETESTAGVTFTDDLAALAPAIGGLVATGLPLADLCGPGNGTLTGSAGDTLLTFSGGALAPGEVCIFSVSLSVLGTATVGPHTNTTSTITATVGGVVVTANPAIDDIKIAGLELTKEFLDDPVIPGDTVTLEFLIENVSTTETATSITIRDDMAAILGGSPDITGDGVTVTDVCGLGNGTIGWSAGDTFMLFSGGTLAPGEMCDFSVVLDVPAAAATGSYVNSTGDGGAAGFSAFMPGLVIFDEATDVLIVAEEKVSFFKSFTDDPVGPGGTVTLEFTLTNESPANGASAIAFTDDLEAALTGLVATGVPASECGGTVSTPDGGMTIEFSGGILAAGATCVFDVTLTVPALAPSGSFTNTTSSITAGIDGSPVTGDPASDALEVLLEGERPLDYGDAPTGGAVGAPTDSYPTLFAQDGARHALVEGGPTLGPTIDSDDDGQPNADATGDDSDLDGDDEDGVSFSATGLFASDASAATGSVDVELRSADPTQNLLNAWIDFNRDGDWLDAGEQIFTDFALGTSDGFQSLSFTIPMDTGPNVEIGPTFARFRLDTFGGLTPMGEAPDGEVEDYEVEIVALDFGDAPDPTYPTLFASDGARHVVPAVPSLFLGASIDTDANGQPNAVATGDDTLDSGDDEDGVLFTSFLVPGTAAAVDVTASAPGLLNAWVDFNANGSWTDAGEQIFTDESLIAGLNSLSFGIPATVAGTAQTFARFRLDSIGGVSEVGLAADGEVEDYLVQIQAADISVTKTDSVTSAVPGEMVTYTIVIANAGPTGDPSVSVTDTFPGVLTCTYTSVAAGGASGNTAAGSGDISDTLAMPAGSSVTYTAACTIDPAATGTLSNTATAVESLNDSVPSNNSATDADTVLAPEADLTIVKTDSPDPVLAEETLTYNITVDNDGPSDAGNVVVTDTLPAGVNLVSTTGCAEDPAGVPTCSLGTIAAGGSASFDIEVTVDTGTVGAITNSASVSSSVTDPDPSDNTSAEDTGVVLPPSNVGFSKSFSPDTIGSGSTSTLTFTIDNTAGGGTVSDLAFTDVLPAGTVIATPASATTDCSSATISAPDGATTIIFSGGGVAAGGSCIVTVNVIGTSTATNVSGSLTSSDGDSGAATATLTVAATLPGFSKSFAPGSIPLGDRSTLTFTIDNSANASAIAQLDFTDNLPVGMVVANPANAATDCLPAALTATPGTSVITLDADGSPALAAGGTCTVTVDVNGTAAGMLNNISGELITNISGAASSSGRASATLEVTVTAIALTKSFLNDPLPSDDTVLLEFTINNFDRLNVATDIAFTDTLPPGAGLVSIGGPQPDVCGAGSIISIAGGVLTFTGGSLAPGAACTFNEPFHIGGPTGIYTNTTDPITATIGGSPVTGNMASDELFVEPAPFLTKEFLDATTLASDPVVNAGDDVVLRFTIVNTSTTSAATDIAFIDELTTFLPFPVTVTLPPVPDPPCGAVSSLALVSLGTDQQGLELTGGILDPAPGAGSTCTFDVTLIIPAGLPASVYTNTTEEITATAEGITVTGDPASDDLTVIGAPQLSKAFSDDPVAPGGIVTLEFTLSHSADAAGDATDIGFTDDLAAAVPGLTATLPPVPDPPCGVGSSLTGSAGDTLVTLMGGTLMPGEDCTFSVTVNVPLGAAFGSQTNTTSDVSATVGGLTVTSLPASDDLVVTPLIFTKEFTDDPVIAGNTANLRFTIDNVAAADATGISFADDLGAALPGLKVTAATGLPLDVCDGTLSGLAGDTFLSFAGGSLLAGTSCFFDVTVEVPAGTADDTYNNITSGVSSSLGVGAAAVDGLIVQSGVLALTKEFTDDPVNPGDTVTLELTLENLSATGTVTDIAFTDDLEGVLTGLAATDVPVNTCGGTATSLSPVFEYSGGTLLPGTSCWIVLDVGVPAGPLSGSVFPNTTSDATGKVGALDVFGEAASDDLLVQLLTFNKLFDGPSVPGDIAVLTFTIQNLDSASAITGLGFSDNLDAVIAGLEATVLPPTPCGAGSVLAGTSFLTLTGASLATAGSPGDSCSFDVTVMVPVTAPDGTFLNTTSNLFQFGLPVAGPATALMAIEPPPTLGKAFAPGAIAVGANSTVTFSIDNTASALAATALDFTDTLPAGVTVASPPGASNTCGGSLTAVAGAGVITFSGGAVAAGASCTVAMDVTSTTEGVFVNTTGDLTSSSGNSGPASDTLTVGMDFDGDGIPDIVDPDDDNDFLPDGADPDPLDPDFDGDLIIDGYDPEPTFFSNVCIGFGISTVVVLENLVVPAVQTIACGVTESITVAPTVQFEVPNPGKLVLVSPLIIFLEDVIVPKGAELKVISENPTLPGP